MFNGIWSQFGYHNPDEAIKEGAVTAITDKQFIASEVTKWLTSKERLMQLKGDRYYHYEFKRDDIAMPYAKGADGEPVRTFDMGRFTVEDNIYANMVDQHVNYALGKPFTLSTMNDRYTELLNLVFDKSFKRLLHNAAINCVNEGIAWIYPYYNEKGELAFKSFPAHEVLPFWKDRAHEDLDVAVRYYTSIAYEGLYEKVIQHVEVYARDGVHYFLLEGGKLIEDVEKQDTAYSYTRDEAGNTVPLVWERIPLIALKFNPHEIPLIKRVYTMQDAINTSRSNWTEGMNKDVSNSILKLYGYGGEGEGEEVRQRIMRTGIVLLDEGGDVQALEIKQDSQQVMDYLKNMRKALIENARGFDGKDDRMSNNPNQMNIKSMYADIDLDADMMETQFQAAFDSLLWFVDSYLQNAGEGDFSKEEVVFTFNRNIMVNDTDVITNIRNSEGIVSRETLLSQHPYVTNVQEEQERIEKESISDNYLRVLTNSDDDEVVKI